MQVQPTHNQPSAHKQSPHGRQYISSAAGESHKTRTGAHVSGSGSAGRPGVPSSRNSQVLQTQSSQNELESRAKRRGQNSTATAGSSSMSELEFHSARRRTAEKHRDPSHEKSSSTSASVQGPITSSSKASHSRAPMSAPKHPSLLNYRTPKHTGVH